MLRRRSTTPVLLLPLPILDLLLRGEVRSPEEQAVAVHQGQEYNQLLRFTTTDEEIRQAWREHRASLLAAWVEEHPGTRPAGWWRFDAREKRRRLGGTGATYADGLDRGIPRWWTTPALARHIGFVAVDPADPPRFESEAAYLDRLGLLTAAERRRLRAAAFEPEHIEAADDDSATTVAAADIH